MEPNPYEAPRETTGGGFNVQAVVRHAFGMALAGSLGAGIGWFAGDVLAHSIFNYKPTLAQLAACAMITTILGAIAFAAIYLALTILIPKQRRL